jgi:putative nucleotidyltransferase with HDIG domain
MQKTRNQALGLLKEYVESSLLKHSLAVESAMRAYAKKYGEDEEEWGIAGLLHDFDYEKFPEKHPYKGVEILKEQGYPESVTKAILGHAEYTKVPREDLMSKCLFAVDELCGFIMACAYVRPEKLKGLKAKSVKKRLKIKSFAAKVNREEITKAVQELGADFDEHIDFVISAMQGISEEIGF